MVFKMTCNLKMNQEQLYWRKKELAISTNICKESLKKSSSKLIESTIWENVPTNSLIITLLIWALLKDLLLNSTFLKLICSMQFLYWMIYKEGKFLKAFKRQESNLINGMNALKQMTTKSMFQNFKKKTWRHN